MNEPPLDAKGIATIIIKITGLVMLVVAIIQIPAYFPLTGRGYDFSIAQTLGMAAAGIGPLALAGLVLWYFPGTVTNRIVSGPAAGGATRDFRPVEIVALTVLGVYLVAHGLVDAVRDTVILIVLNRQDSTAALLPASIVGRMAGTLAELLIGATLCVGSRRVVDAIERLRR